MEFDVKVFFNDGKFVLDFVEGGIYFECFIDIGSGEVIVIVSGNIVLFCGLNFNDFDKLIGLIFI